MAVDKRRCSRQKTGKGTFLTWQWGCVSFVADSVLIPRFISCGWSQYCVSNDAEVTDFVSFFTAKYDHFVFLNTLKTTITVPETSIKAQHI